MTFGYLYDHIFEKKRDELFVYFENGSRLSLSTDEFRTKTEKMARYIFYASKEIEPGSWMILKLKNSGLWPVAFFGALMSGMKVLLLDEAVPARQLKNFIAHVGAKAVLTDSDRDAAQGPPNINIRGYDDCKYPETDTVWADEIAYATSGTTSEAKIYSYNAEAVKTGQVGIFKIWRDINNKHNKKNSVRALQVLPLRHIFGLVTFLCGIEAGYTLIFPENISILELIRTVKTEKPWICAAVPALWKGLLDIVKVKCVGACTREKFESVFGSSLVCGVSAGAKLETQLAKDLVGGAGIVLYNGWGMTETGAAAAGRITDEDTETGYVGNIFEAYDAKILRDDGSIGDCGTGELIINGSGLYTSEISAGGAEKRRGEYFYTGDIFRIENDRSYFIGRRKSVIVGDSGENAYPEEIEEELTSVLMKVRQSCVFDLKGRAALFISDPDIEEKLDGILEEIKNKNMTMLIKNKIAALFTSKSPVEITGKGEVSRFKIVEQIKKKRDIQKYIIMKGIVSDADIY